MNYRCKITCKKYPCGDLMAYPGNCKDFEEIEENSTDKIENTSSDAVNNLNAERLQSDLSDLLAARFPISHNNLPEELWMLNGGFMHLEFMIHDFGFWAILSFRAYGKEMGRVNLGTYKTMDDIDELLAVLKKGS